MCGENQAKTLARRGFLLVETCVKSGDLAVMLHESSLAFSNFNQAQTFSSALVDVVLFDPKQTGVRYVRLANTNCRNNHRCCDSRLHFASRTNHQQREQGLGVSTRMD